MRTSRGPMPWVLLLTVVLLWKEVMCQDEASVVVKLKQGEIFAQRETTAAGKAFYSFRGIPYAQPPVNGLRFRDPIPPSAWYDPLDGSKAPSVCPQLDLDAVQQGEVVLKGNENCLYLNVYAPRPKQGKLPVIVWIHGGAFIAGGAEEYAPMALLDKDIVLVSIQYRLGTLGFLSAQDDVLPGNLALKDQTMALKWVKKNIRDLGGDPERITLMGQSSGAVAAHFQVLAPKAKGLFDKAILQSGSALSPWALRNDHWKVAHTIGQIYNCSGITMDPPALDSTSLLYCLQGLDVKDLVVLPSYFTVFQNAPLVMVPRVDGIYIPDHPAELLRSGRFNKVDLISGFNKDEGALEAMPLLQNADLFNEIAENFERVAPTLLKIGDEDQAPTIAEAVFKHYTRNIPQDTDPSEKFVQMLSDGGFKVPQDELALLHSNQQKVYVYELQHKGQYSTTDLYNNTLGKEWVSHADDLQYLYGNNPYFPPLERAEDLQVQDTMLTLWTNFATTGVPTPGPTLGFVWLPVTRLCLRYLAITPTPFIQTYDRGVMVEFWRNIPLTRNKILFPERFSFHGPFFFQPPAIIPVTSCVDIPGPFVGGIGPGFIGNFGGGVGIPGNGGFFGNGIGRPINGGGIGVRGFGGGRRGGSNFNPFPDLQFNRRGTLPIQNLRSAGNGNKNSDEELQGEGERGGGGSLFSWLPPLKLTSQRISEMQKKVEDFLGL